MSFRTIPQPSQQRPHVEIRSPIVRPASLPVGKGNPVANGFSELAQAYAQRKLKEEQGADPWAGLRDVPSASPLSGLRASVQKLFGLL